MGVMNWNQAADGIRLEYCLSENEEYNDSVVGMLQNNSIPGVLPFSKMQINNQRILQYTLPAGQSIQNVLQNTATRETLLSVLKELANIVYQLKEYMIEDTYVLWDTDYIFYSEDEKVSVICIPVDQNESKGFPLFCDSLLDEISGDFFTDSELDLFKECLLQKKFDPREFYGLLDKTDISSLMVNKRKMINGQHVVLKKETTKDADKRPNAVVLEKRIHSDSSKSRDRSPVILTRRKQDEVSETNAMEETVTVASVKNTVDPVTETEDETIVMYDEDSEETVMITEPFVTGTLERINTGDQYSLIEEENTIGRSKNGNTIIISGNLHIGRHHACIRRDQDHFVFIDLNSKNQSYLNGERMEYGKEYALEHGDEIRLADETFQFCVNGNN